MATDPGLAQGDPVEIVATMNLSGHLDTGNRTSIAAGLMLNTATLANQNWLAGKESISMDTFVDLVTLMPNIGWHYSETLEVGAVDRSDSVVQTFAVGDVVVMESLLRAFAGVPNAGVPREVWVEFGQTAQSSLEAVTPGVILVQVPEPAPAALLLAGLAVLGWVVRRSSGTAH